MTGSAHRHKPVEGTTDNGARACELLDAPEPGQRRRGLAAPASIVLRTLRGTAPFIAKWLPPLKAIHPSRSSSPPQGGVSQRCACRRREALLAPVSLLRFVSQMPSPKAPRGTPGAAYARGMPRRSSASCNSRSGWGWSVRHSSRNSSFSSGLEGRMERSLLSSSWPARK